MLICLYTPGAIAGRRGAAGEEGVRRGRRGPGARDASFSFSFFFV